MGTLPRLLLAVFVFAASAAASAQGLGLGDLEARLKLTPEQKKQFDVAAAASKRALFSIGLAALQVQARLASELRKDVPDFDAVAREQEDAIAMVRPLFDEARSEWTRLYGTMSAEQAAIARTEIERRLGMLEGATRELARRFGDMLRDRSKP